MNQKDERLEKVDAYTDVERMENTLNNYDRCLSYRIDDDGRIIVKSGMYPHWRRFQRDLLGPTVNIQGHGYTITHVHKRKMLFSEMHEDEDFDHLMPEFVPYEDRPECCIITLTPIMDFIEKGR